ncbi:hypothetical protein G5V58_13305 [Nocardioides anomalus]|uniref:Uncharacterized protein n=1 Tax=Nocardioides anomalus TaxID=2712223 RepID=A0A6G6WES4_9ACTN|nr:hypothetical protein [Nocardioides anomalus]QIG43605.1 hypothetical protein G5V58_13305 [Nocardioides anomalus]
MPLHPPQDPAPRRRARAGLRGALLGALAALVTAAVIGAGVLLGGAQRGPMAAAPPATRAPAAVLGAAGADAAPPEVAVLRAWDAARADAWARGDPALLRPLYTPGSAAGRRDRAMLRAWADRGLVVRDLATRLLAVRTLQRSADRWTLQVTDRVTGAAAARDGTALGPLPRDGPTTRTVHLRLLDGRWRVSAVRPA